MNKPLKSVVACVIASALGGQLGYMTIGLIQAIRQSPPPYFHLDPWGIFIGLVLAGVPMVVVGIPVQAILQHFKLTDYYSNVGLSTVCGALLAWYFATSLDDILLFTLLGTWVAFLTGSIAWLIRRPDKDPNAKSTP